MQKPKITIAVDGFSSCGKSSMAKALARKIGYLYIDSGAMYRAVTLFCLEHGLISGTTVEESALRQVIDDIDIAFRSGADGVSQTWMNGRNVEDRIRTLEVSDKVSYVSALPFVRQALVAKQRKIGANKGIVMDGRDIGTTVFPDAELKIFVTASPETRARRRMRELSEKGERVSFEAILENIRKRDYLDQHRTESPLRKAPDAVMLDNSDMTIPEQDAWLERQFCLALQKVEKR